MEKTIEARIAINKKLDKLAIEYRIVDKTVLDVEGDLLTVIERSRKLNYYEGIVDAYTILIKHYLLTERADQAHQILLEQKALIDYKLVSDQYLAQLSLSYVIYLIDTKGKLEEAKKYYKLGSSAAKKYQDMDSLYRLYVNYGVFLSSDGDYDEASKFFKQAELYYVKQENKQVLMYIYENLADNYLLQKLYDDAYKYFDKGYQLGLKLHDAAILTDTTIGLANIYAKRGDVEKAKKYIKEGISHATVGKSMRDIFTAILGSSQVYITLAMYDEAYLQLKKFENEVEDIKGIWYKLEFYKHFSKVCAMLGKYEEAYYARVLYHQYDVSSGEHSVSIEKEGL